MQKYGKRFIALLLCCAGIFLFAACNGEKSESPSASTEAPGGAAANETSDQGVSSQTPPASARDTLTIAVSADAGTLDPKDTNVYVRTWAEPLYDLTPDGDRFWKLATGVDEITPTQWIIHLREGVTFSNGNPFNADDVLFTFDVLERGENRVPSFPTLDWEINPPKKLDDYTVELNFTVFDISIANNFITVHMYDAETYDAATYSDNPIGTGPYVVTNWVVNSSLDLTANENYWGGPPKIKRIKYKVIGETEQIVNGLATGTVDVAEIASQDTEYVSSLPEYELHKLSTNSINAVWFNTSEASIMSRRDARKAVCHAINKEAIINLVYYGNAEIPKWPLPNSFLDYKESYSTLDPTYSVGYDPELAKAYAESAGITGESVRIATSGSSADITIAEIIQQNLKDIGVTAVINNYDIASYLDVTVDLTMYDFLIWEITAPSRMAPQAYYGWFTYEPCFNEGVWEGIDRFADISAAAGGTYDVAERTPMVDELTEILERESFWYAFAEAEVSVAVNADLTGVDFMFYRNSNFQNWAWAN
ncbi:MAG: ABC transporter substrate-binding protein [Oscillospiraceae bacterium]|jgi:peptide/nickel transport system substrate-binding protein|nr:ABC transporter substrate-binding protein [Oscillospiraceae bacterium]